MDTIVKFEAVSKQFNREQILKNISFEIKKKDVVGLIGPNGAGKTTIIRLILGSIRANSGLVEVFGESNDKEVREKNKNIGVVLERNGFDGKVSAEDNIYYYCHLFDIEKSEAKARIEKMKSALGLEINIRAPVNTYSKGMIQQLAILKGLVHKPQLLILDEPTSGLDPVMQAVFQRLLKDLSRIYGITIIVSSHNLKELENVCTKFLIINKGEQKLFSEKKIAFQDKIYKVTFAIDNGKKIGEDLFKPLLENKTLLNYQVLDGRITCEINDPQNAYHINRRLAENNFPVNDMYLRKKDIEDLYFEIIGETRHDKNIDIY